MSALVEPSLFDSIAALVPEGMRERYYARMAHLQTLHPQDEILRVCEAMGFLALIIREAPALVATEREELAVLVQSAVESNAKLQEAIRYLAPDITKRVNVDAIALRVGEGIRQQLQNTGLLDVANALKSTSHTLHSAVKEFNLVAHDLIDPKGGLLSRMNSAVQHFDGTLRNSMERLEAHARSLDRKGSQHHMYLMCFGFASFLVFGIALGLFVGRFFR